MKAVEGDVQNATGSEQIEVFISYSRDDLAFVDRLQQALDARGVRATVDREDIAKSEDWWMRIRQLIAQADTIVFVLSPSSLRSKVCQQEVDYAVGLNKRFIPVVVADLDDTPVPEALARLNYIFFTANPDVGASGNFDEAVGHLSHALETDIGWIRRHTLYGERAGEWDRAGRNASRLLRGGNIDEAEAWRDQRPHKAPEMTDVQLAYIAESRKAATRRQRWWIGGSVAVAIITSALAVFAFLQQQAAVASQERTVRVLASSDFQQGVQAIEIPETTPEGLAFLARSVRGGQDPRALTRLWTMIQQRSFWIPERGESIPVSPPRPGGAEGLAAQSVHGAPPKVPEDIARRFARHTVDGTEQETKFIAISGDGSRVLTIIGDVAFEGTDVKARVWQADGRPVTGWFEPVYKGQSYVFRLTGVLSHDGRFLALEVIGQREPAFLEFWDLEKNTRFEETVEVTGLQPLFQNSWFTYIGFIDKPHGDDGALATLLTASRNGDVLTHYIHDGYITTGGRARHREVVSYAAIDDEREWLMSGGEDGTVNIASSLDADRPVGTPLKLATRITRIARDGANGLVVDTAGGIRTHYRLLQPMRVTFPATNQIEAEADCIMWPEFIGNEARQSVAEFAPQSGVRLSYASPRSFQVLVNGETHQSPVLDVNLELVCLDRAGARIALTTEDFVTQVWTIDFARRVGLPLDEKLYFGSGPTPEDTRSVAISADGSRVLVRSFFWNPPNVAYWWFNLWDTGTALPLFDRKLSIDWTGDTVPVDAVFDTSEAFVTFTGETETDRRALLEQIQIAPPEGVGDWLPDFAEALGGIAFDDNGLPAQLPADERAARLDAGLERLRQHAAP
ncbi:toll/interleukin-1 receptor domain-containing protein [Hoeflea sp.]|uniref:toll/interleukin-1 receptor domain-containing protein n=1 Tax=Hoeflea sp. TaxID=1940281 RepID=UPI003B0243A5